MRTEITRPIARWSYFQRRLAFAGALAALALGCGGERSDGVGTTGEKVGEIQGGTQEFGFPWVGAVIDSAGTLCTGSLISQNLVLTAGHCLTSNPRRFCTWADCRGVLNDSNSIAVDQAWNGIWGDTTSDTAILHLAKPIYNIAPGIITPGNPSPPPGPPWGVQPTSVYGIETGTICTAVGYGLHGGLSCQTGQCAVKYSGLEQIVAIGTGIASTYYQGIGVYNTTGLIDSGDSGGPLYCGAIAGIAIAKYPATGYPSEGFYNQTYPQWTTDFASAFTADTALSVTSWTTGRLDAFSRNFYGQVQDNSWNGSAWTTVNLDRPTSTGIVGTPEAISWAKGLNRIDVFVLADNGHLFHRIRSNGVWSNSWYDRGGGWGFSHVSAASWGANRLDVVGVNPSGQVIRVSCDGAACSSAGTWPLQGTIGGDQAVGQVRVVTMQVNRLDVFALDGNRTMHHTTGFLSNNPPTWTTWESLGGPVNSQYTVLALPANGRMEVLATAASGSGAHKAFYGGLWHPSQTGWESLGGVIIGGMTATTGGPNYLDVFVQGSDRRLYHKALPTFGGTWEANWDSEGGDISGTPAAVSWGPGRLDVFSLWNDLSTTHIAYENGWGSFAGLGVYATW